MITFQTSPRRAPHPEAPAQQAFARACLDPEAPVPANLSALSPERARRRFSIYRNNVWVSLLEAMAARFPAVEAVVGADFFREAARQYVRARPPSSPILARLGGDFPEFLAAFEPAAGLDYLPDLARLELAAGEAYHAADAESLAGETLAALSPEEAGALHLRLHPAARLLRSAHPVATIWRMNLGHEPLGPIAAWAGEDVLVTRPAFTVEVQALPPGGAALLEALTAGASLGDAAQAALAHPGADMGRILGALVSAGALLPPSSPSGGSHDLPEH